MIQLNKDELYRTQFLDNSGMACFKRCPARYCFRNILGLTTPEPRPALDYGTAIHCAMPWLQRGMLGEAIKAFSDSWEASGNAPDSKRNDINAVKMLSKWHAERFSTGNIPYEVIEPPQTAIQMKEHYSDQEFAFSVDLGAAMPFQGRVDAAGREKVTGELCVVEYKTTSELSTRFHNAFKISSQLIGYATALSIITGENCNLAFLEALRVTSANPENLCTPTPIQPHMLDSFVDLFQQTSSDIQHCLERNEWVKDFTACAPYGQFGSHGYLCEFHLLCTTHDWRVFKDAFVVDRWEPFEVKTPSLAQMIVEPEGAIISIPIEQKGTSDESKRHAEE